MVAVWCSHGVCRCHHGHCMLWLLWAWHFRQQVQWCCRGMTTLCVFFFSHGLAPRPWLCSAAYRRQEMVALSWVLLLQFGGLVLLGQILVVLGRTHVLVASCMYAATPRPLPTYTQLNPPPSYEPFGVGACPDAATSGLATWVNTTRLDCCIPHLPRHPECAWVRYGGASATHTL